MYHAMNDFTQKLLRILIKRVSMYDKPYNTTLLNEIYVIELYYCKEIIP